MKRFHLIFGLLLVIAFLLTGQYMDRFLQHLQSMPDGPRMLYRSRHIYILLSGLINLGIGAYFISPHTVETHTSAARVTVDNRSFSAIRICVFSRAGVDGTTNSVDT
ncbi:MAG: hypothetical protein DMF69_04235 [Acidobacteria bacterium]|nr:MAG: hypothetical protein DMF69_04235 [Acidobacteriota bacterium]